MNLFADYIQPLTLWLQANPSWSLFITFIIALSESLAIIGSIVPGSVTMTAIGILAGSGVMRIDLTLLASSLGAICGDSLSYALGYFYSEKLIYIWPFKKYPHWLSYGKDFFTRHGGKSVLIGRFVGPLRSIIPVIAGIMHMKQWRFLIANVISAVGWSLLYVMPGVLIGAAGHELSAESATRLFIIILLLLLVIWLFSLFLKWTVLKLHSFLKNNLHGFWSFIKKLPYLNKLYDLLTPKDEVNHYATSGLVLLTLISLLGALVFLGLAIQDEYINAIDLPVHLFLQSLHTHILEAVCIVCTQLTSTITIAVLYLSSCLWFFYHKKLRAVLHVSFLVIMSCVVSFALNHLVYSPRPQGLLITMPGSSFPNATLLVATALYGFIFYYINNKYSLLTNTLRSLILIVLGLSGLGSIYLGDYWLSDVLAAYFIGAFLCLLTCIFYRKTPLPYEKKSQSVIILTLLLASIVLSTLISIYLNFKDLVYAHTPFQKEYVLDHTAWWDQQQPMLPLYRLSRVGKRTSLLNIQYSGDLNQLQNSLEEHGWVTHNETLFKKILVRINDTSNEIKLPLLTQLYQNKRPELVMTYKDLKTHLIFEFIIWESNYHLDNAKHPLWIGTLSPLPLSNQDHIKPVNIFSYIMPSLSQFALRKITLRDEVVKTTAVPNDASILLIKEQEE